MLIKMKNIIVLISVFSLSFIFSCKKNENAPYIDSSVRLLSSNDGLSDLKMAKGIDGNILIVNSYGKTDVNNVVKQQFKLLSPKGETIRSFSLNDTLFQYIDIMPGIDNGYFVVASISNKKQINWFKLNNDGDIVWSGVKNLIANGFPLFAPAVNKSYDNNYFILYHNSGAGYFIHKLDMLGDFIFNKKIPEPNAIHQGTGLNFGETVNKIFQPNDSMIIVQGTTIDKYNGISRINCFVRALSSDVTQKWFSTNFDSTRTETAASMQYINSGKILLFATKTQSNAAESYGDPLIREYTLAGSLSNQIVYSRVDGTPTIIKKAIVAQDGSFLLIGSNNQFDFTDLVSPNKMILMKINQDLSFSWSKTIHTIYPSRAFDATYFDDGTIGLVGFIKENLTINKVIYLHLDAKGVVIPN